MRFILTITLLCFISLSSNAQDIEKMWGTINYNAQGAKAIKALQAVKNIYQLALAKGDLPNQARAAVMIVQFSAAGLEGDEELIEYNTLDSLISRQKGIVKYLLLSRKASFLEIYGLNNRYRINRIAVTEGAPGTSNFQEWDRKRLGAVVAASHLAALEDTAALQSQSLTRYRGMMISNDSTRYLRPTLYDLLAHRALDYFNGQIEEGEHMISPVNFAPAPVFTTAKPEIDNSLEIYKRLLRFHTRQGNEDALVHADLERIDFVRDYVDAKDKEELYVNALEEMRKTYRNMKGQSLCTYQLAYYYHSKTAGTNDSTKQKLWNTKAMDLCIAGSLEHPDSEGSRKCAVLKNNMLLKIVKMQSERVNEPGKPFRVLVDYKNVRNIYTRLIKIDQAMDLGKWSTSYPKKTWKALLELPVYKSWQQPLRDPLDYMEHTVEVKVDALETGRYVLIASADKNFNVDGNSMAAQPVLVSNIAYIYSRENSLYALHRSTGKPLKGITLLIKAAGKVNYVEKQFTDALGHVQFKYKGPTKSEPVCSFINGKDTLLVQDGQSLVSWEEDEDEEEREEEVIETFYYADRAIYRPGQTVFFKGIQAKKKQQYELFAETPVKVFLYDDNGRKIDSLNTRSNDFGSFTGSFRLPANLTGSVRIKSELSDGELYVSVEEYKRPKFEVTFEVLKGIYKLFDSIRVSGHAIAFSGNNLSNANVKWNVWRRPNYRVYTENDASYASAQLAAGEMITDAAGNFSITFCPLPDPEIKENRQLFYNYEVTADVTDANGETRSGTYHVRAGHHEIVLDAGSKTSFTLSELKTFRINSHNANNEFIPAPVKVTLTKLTHPGRLMRSRYWKQPDQFVMTEKEYHQYFPIDIYKDENDRSTWAKGTIYEEEGTTAANKRWNLLKPGLSAGTYVLSVKGKEGELEKIIEVIDKDSHDFPEYTWYLKAAEKVLEPGATAHIDIGTSGETYLLQQVPQMQNVTLHTIAGTKERIAIPIEKSHRGGIFVSLAYVKDNRLFAYTLPLNVPWSDKQLDISIASHRNKLLPGEKETWKLSVKAKGDKQPASELLATMYDASLDEIKEQQWELPGIYPFNYRRSDWLGGSSFDVKTSINIMPEENRSIFEPLPFDNILESYFTSRQMMTGSAVGVPMMKMEGDAEGISDLILQKEESKPKDNPPPPPRKDFRETVLFIPQLKINGEDTASINFTMPEALTRWKFLAFAHTKELQFGLASSEVITQKPLMVAPNAPRFLREGDKVELSARISNVTDSQLIGQAKLMLIDPDNMQPVDGWFANIFPLQHFTVAGRQATQVSFQFKVPQGYNKSLVYRITAESGKFTDGEEAVLPVLSNRMMVTESMPVYMRGNGKKDYTFEKLLHSNNSQTLQHQAITVSYNSSPIWYAVQALPYLMEFPHQCAEQVFSRYYANAVAAEIVKTTPRIRSMIKDLDTATLEKDAAIKSALLEETPWVKETNNLALLQNVEKMGQEASSAYRQLQDMQSYEGAFPWFRGMQGNRYITQHILTGIGRLKMLKINTPDKVIKPGLKYLDNSWKKDTTFNMDALQYLYMRSFFPEYPSTEIVKRFTREAEKNWQKQSIYGKGMTALVLFRQGNVTTANKIMQNLKENASQSDEMGMYWKSVTAGYYWYEAPVETQSLLIEAFSTITKDQAVIDGLKTWLLRQKQTNSWSTTRSTADACYALLMNGTNWLNATPEAKIIIGGETVTSKDGNIKARFEGKEINTKMGKVELQVTGNSTQPSWGSVYWQYFEQLDKISPAKSGLSVQRELYIEKNGKLSRITETQPLHVGDKVTMRIVVKADRDMEFVHLKDMRPACLEPIDVLSSYKNGYYQSTKDLATHFFFDRLNKGVRVLEYSLFVSHAGKYTGGISTLQCMYAPEFNANSAGLNVVVE